MKQYFFLVGAMLLITLAPSSKTVLAETSVIVGEPVRGFMYAPVYIAEAKGLFRKRGLDTKIVNFGGGSININAFVAGTTQVFLGDPDSLVRALLEGFRAKIVMGIVRGLNLALATQPEIKTGADLKGKSVGISDFTGLPHTALLIALKQLGLQKNDITYVKTGGKSLRFQALITKRVAATILDPPFTTMAQEKGFKLITDLTNLNVPYMRVLIAVPEKALLENSGTATAFVEAVSEGIKFYKDTKNKEETIQILAKYMRLSPVEKRQMLEEGIATYLDMTPTKSYPYPKDLQIVLDTIAESNFKAKNVNPASFVDMALVQRLDETGFFGRPGK